MTDRFEARLRVRVAAGDAHYAEGLVAGAWVLGLFGDLATELCIFHDGDEGLMRAYDSVEFLAPIRAGDFIEGRGSFASVGRTSRRFTCEAWRVIELDAERGGTAGRILAEPVLVARASGTVVVPTSLSEEESTAHGA
jgi:3-aminobutyryl-CoA ammonia-lyase